MADDGRRWPTRPATPISRCTWEASADVHGAAADVRGAAADEPRAAARRIRRLHRFAVMT